MTSGSWGMVQGAWLTLNHEPLIFNHEPLIMNHRGIHNVEASIFMLQQELHARLRLPTF